MEEKTKIGIIICDRYRRCAGENASDHCGTEKVHLAGTKIWPRSCLWHSSHTSICTIDWKHGKIQRGKKLFNQH